MMFRLCDRMCTLYFMLDSVLLKKFDDMFACCLAVGNNNALGCMRCNVDHFLEGWVLDNLYRLHFEVRMFMFDTV